MSRTSIAGIKTMKHYLEVAAEMLPVPQEFLTPYVEVIAAIEDAEYNGGIATVSEESLDQSVRFMFIASKFAIEQAAMQKMEVDAVSQEDRHRMKLESPKDYMEYRRRWYQAERLSERALKFRLSLDATSRSVRQNAQ